MINSKSSILCKFILPFYTLRNAVIAEVSRLSLHTINQSSGSSFRETSHLTTFYPLAFNQPNPACALRSGDLDRTNPIY
jgi:hypothetical protein